MSAFRSNPSCRIAGHTNVSWSCGRLVKTGAATYAAASFSVASIIRASVSS